MQKVHKESEYIYQITDRFGKSQIFENRRDTAKYLKVQQQSLKNAIHFGVKIAGHYIERIHRETFERMQAGRIKTRIVEHIIREPMPLSGEHGYVWVRRVYKKEFVTKPL